LYRKPNSEGSAVASSRLFDVSSRFARSRRAVYSAVSFRQTRAVDLPKKLPAKVHTLLRIDTRTIPDGQDEIRAFMTVRDEMLRLSRTLDHYRSIGVARFF